MDSCKSDFGVIVKKRLVELKMTQRQLAKILDMNENYLTDILAGRKSGIKYRLSILREIGLENK
ncbi:XRE family transcriptional regulator [Romboutsia weinsteinii]|uniref:XRE family transcriptional regulator n=1 Tax=Romboutsia weinsteinii TaxID=2020949 RepID=A0A371J3Y0_9FIRM|nr:XRE family transcriptional regulator [Romboutsia weinsteinii]